MQRGVQVTQAFRNEIGKAVKTKRLTTGRTQKAFSRTGKDAFVDAPKFGRR